MTGVVITGLGAVASNGIGKEEFWKSILSGKSGIHRISRFDPSGYPCQIAGEIPSARVDEINSLYKSNGEQSWSTALVLMATRMAVQDAGLTPGDIASVCCGVSVGISTTDIGYIEEGYPLFQREKRTIPKAIMACFPHASASRVAQEYKCKGKVITISTGCPSGLHGVIYAVEAILRGEADMMLAGGADAPITPLLLASFSSAGVLPGSFNENPEKASRPFDRKREGGVMAEGAGILILEEERHAKMRGAKIYARIAGWGMSTALSQKNMRQSMVISISQAMKHCGLKPDDLDYICAHAPGDPLVDRAETGAIKEVLGRSSYNIPVSSIKSMIGNPLAASGPLQLITSAMAIQEQCVPPTINLEFPDRNCDLDYVPNRWRVARVNTSLINLHGFGGSNAAMIITAPDSSKRGGELR